MNMSEIQVGEVYVGAEMRRKKMTPTHRHYKVLETDIQQQYRTRRDRVRVVQVEQNDKGEWEIPERNIDPLTRKPTFAPLVSSRELMTEAQAKEILAELEREQIEQERYRQEQQEFQQEHETVIAMRLGISDTRVTVFAARQAGELYVMRASISGDGVREVMSGDPDIETITAALEDIPPSLLPELLMRDIAERIVGSLRANGNDDV